MILFNLLFFKPSLLCPALKQCPAELCPAAGRVQTSMEGAGWVDRDPQELAAGPVLYCSDSVRKPNRSHRENGAGSCGHIFTERQLISSGPASCFHKERKAWRPLAVSSSKCPSPSGRNKLLLYTRETLPLVKLLCPSPATCSQALAGRAGLLAPEGAACAVLSSLSGIILQSRNSSCPFACAAFDS